MTLPLSGPISLSDIQTEFGGPISPIGLQDYYKGGAYVHTYDTAPDVPTSGAISLSNFYGAAQHTPVFHNLTYTTSDTLVIGFPVIGNLVITMTGGTGGTGSIDQPGQTPFLGYSGHQLAGELALPSGGTLTISIGGYGGNGGNGPGGAGGAGGSLGYAGGTGGVGPNSGGGGGGGGATVLAVDGTVVAVAAGGAGGGGAGQYSQGQPSQGYASNGTIYGGAGAGDGHDGGGGGGGGGGQFGGQGGAQQGGDNGAYSGSDGADLLPNGSWTATTSRSTPTITIQGTW